MLMDEGLDTGPVLARAETPIGSEEDAGTLGARLAELGAPLVVETLRGLERGSVEPVSQDHSAATYAPKLLPEERTIDWTQAADAIVRRVRALAPEPGAVTTFRHGRLKVLGAEPKVVGNRIDIDPPVPGRLGTDEDGTPTVDARRDLVRLLDVAPAGRKQMTGAEWARGARIEPLEHLG
jgi:methionyl-tRNA formyltransferase